MKSIAVAVAAQLAAAGAAYAQQGGGMMGAGEGGGTPGHGWGWGMGGYGGGWVVTIGFVVLALVVIVFMMKRK